VTQATQTSLPPGKLWVGGLGPGGSVGIYGPWTVSRGFNSFGNENRIRCRNSAQARARAYRPVPRGVFLAPTLLGIGRNLKNEECLTVQSLMMKKQEKTDGL
jgi:hypothetical protein